MIHDDEARRIVRAQGYRETREAHLIGRTRADNPYDNAMQPIEAALWVQGAASAHRTRMDIIELARLPVHREVTR